MKIISFLEKNSIATKETLQIFLGTTYFYFLSWILLKQNLPWFSFSLMFITLGGFANLCVIDFNNFHMPVSARNWREFNQLKRINQGKDPSRRISILDKRTKLSWLCDRFCIGKSIFSIGDLIIFFGCCLIILLSVIKVIDIFFWV